MMTVAPVRAKRHPYETCRLRIECIGQLLTELRSEQLRQFVFEAFAFLVGKRQIVGSAHTRSTLGSTSSSPSSAAPRPCADDPAGTARTITAKHAADASAGNLFASAITSNLQLSPIESRREGQHLSS